MPGLQDLPVELHAHIARAVDKGLRTELSLANRSWNRICTPLIWEEITLWYARETDTYDRYGYAKSVCHPLEVVDDYLPRFDCHLRRVNVEIGTPYKKDMGMLVRAVRLVPQSVEITLEAEFSCNEFVEALEPEDFGASIKVLARVAHRFVSIHLDTNFQYSNIEQMVNPLAAFFAKAVGCRSCFLRIDDTLNDLLPAVLQLPKLEDLTLQVEDLARLDVSIPPKHALRSLSLEVVDRHNADAACALVKKYAGTLRHLSLNCCSPTGHNGFPVAFPNLKSLTVQARRGPVKLFALVDPCYCPRLRDICHPGIEIARLVDQLPNFLDALGSAHRNPRIRLRIQPIEVADDVYDEYSAESERHPDGPSTRAELRRICDERKVDVLEEGVFDVFEYPSRTELSLVNRDWNRICAPIIWEEITLWYSRLDPYGDYFDPEGSSICHPVEVVDDYLPRCARHVRNVKVQVGPMYEKDMELLLRAVRLVPESAEITLEVMFSCDVYMETLGPEALDRPLASVAQVAKRFVGVHVDIYFGCSDEIEIADALSSFFAKVVNCRTFYLRMNRGPAYHSFEGQFVAAILPLPKLEDLTLRMAILAGVDVSLLTRPLRRLALETTSRNSADATYALVEANAGTLRDLSLNNCLPTNGGGDDDDDMFPLAFPALTTLTVRASAGPVSLFALLNPYGCPQLRDIVHPGYETVRLVEQLPGFLDASA